MNKLIDKYNLLVPILNSKMFHFTLEPEAESVVKTGQTNLKRNENESDAEMPIALGLFEKWKRRLIDIIER